MHISKAISVQTFSIQKDASESIASVMRDRVLLDETRVFLASNGHFKPLKFVQRLETHSGFERSILALKIEILQAQESIYPTFEAID